MKIFNPFFYFIVAVAISSCSSSKKEKDKKQISINEPLTVKKKKLELTEYEKNNWQHLDLETDTIPGMSVNKAYEFLKGKKGVEVVVGVIDTGVDLKHEDLADVIWVNKNEVLGNGVDDDKNGYVDDVNGWNFLGKSYKEHLEYERILKNPSLVSKEEFEKIREEYEGALEASGEQKYYFEEELSRNKKTLEDIENADKAFKKHFKGENYTEKNILAIKTNNKTLQKHINFVKKMIGFSEISWNEVKKEISTNAKMLIEDSQLNEGILSGENLKENFRSVVGDNPYDINDTNYGNGNVSSSKDEEMHSSHVSGIIAAKRNNSKGINGIANNAKIMVIRAVPDGDEYDKDIALGIRYAVDNGAKVINASFGKYYSPKKEWVYEAIKYAAEKDVLIVNAAGNDSKDVDKKQSFPNDRPDFGDEIANNLITVGASSSNYNKMLVGNFSNFGKENVDIFAPGVSIYSAMPNNKYAYESGTSMASPCVAGVAALIRSYYPQLNASQVKNIILNSGTKINLEVMRPVGFDSIGEEMYDQTEDLIDFSDLCASGSIVNAYNAVKMAEKEANKTK